MRDRSWIVLTLISLAGFGLAIVADPELRGIADRLEARQTAQPVTADTVGTSTQCSVLVKQPWAPTPDSGWTVQFWRQQTGLPRVNMGVLDSSSPYQQPGTIPTGTHNLGATWTRTGSATIEAPALTYTCGTGGTTPPPTQPTAVACVGSWQGKRQIADLGCQPTNKRTLVYSETFVVTTPASVNPPGTACVAANGATRETREEVSCVYVPPPTGGLKPIYGVVDPTILGTCSAATHDLRVVDVGLPHRFRTWHPQTDITGCVYAHEHGFNPAEMRDPEIAAAPVAFGVVGYSHRTAAEPNGHEEAHEGFKVFIANPGDRNDEGRVNRVFSRSVFHMGTGGPRRFTLQHHSASIRLKHPEFGLKAFTQLMMNTGQTGAVCDPRTQAPVKDVMQLNSPCKLNSGYEIWSTEQNVKFQGQQIYRAFATPAVFDPITVLDRANPTAVVYAWDPRMAGSKNFPTDDWSGNRGCDRESYAQPGYWTNTTGRTEFWTDAMGNEVASNAPYALMQVISATPNNIGSPATNDGLFQFKMRRGFCGQRGQLGLKN